MRRSDFQRDLNAIPADYRAPVLRYIEHGALPENRLLLALLTGNYRYCVEEIDPDLAAILNFLTRHCPAFAYGSMENAVRWEFIRKTIRATGEDAPAA